MDLVNAELVKEFLLILKKHKQLKISDNAMIRLQPSPIVCTWTKKKTWSYGEFLNEQELLQFLLTHVKEIYTYYTWVRPETQSFDLDTAIEIINNELLLRLKAKKEVERCSKMTN